MDEICSFPYINRIYENVMDVETHTLRDLYQDLHEADCIVLLGSGRSFYAASIPLSQLSIVTGKRVISPEDVGFPGGDLYEAARKLDEMHDEICILVCSGSGETTDPRISAQEAARYIEEKNKGDKFTIDVITSHPNSTIGKIGKKYGNVVELKGRREGAPSDYGEGIMGDVFELGSAYILEAVLHAVYYENAEKMFDYIGRTLPLIGKMIDGAELTYEEAINVMEGRCNVYGAGKGIGEKVVKTLLIRLHHVKGILGDGVYMARGINTPRPRRGDLQIAVSCSGETEVVVEWARNFKELGGYQLSIVGDEDSRLTKLSDLLLVLPGRSGEIRDFYVYALFCTSSIPLLLLERYRDRGLNIPPSLLRYYHSVIE